MKTTIDIDEAKLKRVMRWAGLSTRREAVDYALSTAERTAKLERCLSSSLFDGIPPGPVVDPSYDVVRLRENEKPGRRAT